jgi:hypothetical protein
VRRVRAAITLPRVILGAIVVGASLLSLYWAFLVPIFQAPDEPSHLDYALSIYDTHGLLNLRDRPTEPTYFAFAHPTTNYLVRKTGFLDVLFESSVGMSRDYGTRAYYADLDRNAPPTGSAPTKNPFIVSLYPFGYYALVAIWLAVLSPLHLSLVGMFFAARILSVVLLAMTLFLTYAVARELKLKPALALTLTAVIGSLPLTSFVSSYIQPDNLGFTLVTLSIYLSLRARRAMFAGWWVGGLGLALGTVLVTKYQFYICILIPILAMLVSERLFAPKRWGGQVLMPAALVALIAPSIVFGAIQAWVLASDRPAVGAVSTNGTQFTISSAAFFQNLHGGPVPFFWYLVADLREAFYYFYIGPSAHSFWGVFGWLDAPISIHSPQVSDLVQAVEVALTILILVLMLVRMENVVGRLIALARRGRRRWALRIAFGNPFLNSYLLFSVFMFGLWVLTNATFGPQGRNWLPYLLPAFSVGVIYAPKVLTHKRSRAAFSGAIVAALVAYCLVGGYYAIKTIKQRYYTQALAVTSVDLAGQQRLTSGSAVGIDKIDGVGWPDVGQGTTVTIAGWAIDAAHQSLGTAVVVVVDGSLDFPGVYGFARQDVVDKYHVEAYRNSGFSVTFSTSGLAEGPHKASVELVSSAGGGYYELLPVDFTVSG